MDGQERSLLRLHSPFRHPAQADVHSRRTWKQKLRLSTVAHCYSALRRGALRYITSNRSTSSLEIPAWLRTLGMAMEGPIPMIRGATPGDRSVGSACRQRRWDTYPQRQWSHISQGFLSRVPQPYSVASAQPLQRRLSLGLRSHQWLFHYPIEGTQSVSSQELVRLSPPCGSTSIEA